MSTFKKLLRVVICTSVGVIFFQSGMVRQAMAQRVTAFPGQPYGVAHVSVQLPNTTTQAIESSRGFSISDPSGRVFYPVFKVGNFSEVAGGIVQEVLGTNPIPNINFLNVAFLFTGTEPFEVILNTPTPQTLLVQPDLRRARLHSFNLAKWWRMYHENVRGQVDQGDYPPLVETYLSEMLSARLRLEAPLLSRRRESELSQLQQTTQLLFGTEELRLATLRETMRGGGGVGEVASIPVPNEVEWTPLELPAQDPVPAMEPIALHVPEECYYIRFGSFENYLWLDHLKDDYGGDIGRMTTLRGHNARLEDKFQKQLALKQSETSELLGPNFISDVALLGTDLYLKEGAAMGVLFEAKNSFALTASFTSDRSATLKEFKNQGATLETVKVGDKSVSFLSTPDNLVRSFYVVDGQYHLVTSSRTLVERFLEAGAGKGALGASREFQNARSRMTLEQEHTVFAYFSSAFFRNLLSPQYQIELSRRLQSSVNMELIHLATLAAQGEQLPHATLDDLVQGGFLPNRFNSLQETQRPVQTDVGPVDPVRGRRGYFTPIPDVPLTEITPSELKLYQQFAAYSQAHWPQMDPLLVGVKRYALEEQDRMERVVIDANVSPLVEEKYGWLLSIVGPPTDVTLMTNPDDIINVQMSLKGGLLWPAIEPHHLYLGVQDAAVGEELIPSGFFQTLKLLRTTPGFIGAWPQLGLLELLPGLLMPPDVNGMSPLPLGVWRWQGNGFSSLSFNPDILLSEAPFMEARPSENHAQVRLRVGDLTQSQLASWVSMLNYSRAFEASLGNVRLLNSLSQQLRIPPADAMQVANNLLNTELICTLNGNYEFKEDVWQSSAWPQSQQLPTDYQAPLLEWFRGCTADFSKHPGEVELHVELDMLRKEREAPKTKLPSFNFFGK